MTTARASRQERTDGRTGKVCSALITAATLLGCTENQAATTDVHNGTGIVTPNVIVTDPAVPGGKVASVEVDDVAIEPLRMHLANLFAPDDVEAHAVIVFNPTLVPLGCTAGPGRACLRVRLNAEGVSILPGLTDIQTDSSRVSLPTFMTPLEVNDLNTVGFDLTPLDAKGQVDTKSSFYRLSRYLHDDDAEVRLKLRADELKLESRGGRAGLWMAGTLTIDRNVAHWCKETAQGTYESTLPLSDCEEILTKMNDELEDYVTSPTCHRVNVYLVMGQVHFWLGLIPDADAGCSPVAFRPDLDWMQYAPAGRSYQQGCLRVTPEVRVFAKVDPLKIGQDWDGDIGVLASVAQCSTAVDLWCGNCMTLASEKAAPQVQARLNNEVKKSLEQQIGPFFAYQGGQTSPYAAAALPGTACNPISDTACQAQVRKHDLPASVTRLAFGWFANAFGDFSTSASPGQYPVVRVRTNPSGCPPGSSLAVHATTADRCVACPLPCEYSANHDSCRDTILDLPCATLFSTAVESVALDYAIDPDADGIPQPQDNCPGAWNPVQTDQDGDGLGAACETCDCDNAPNPDPDHDGICTNACNAQGDNCPHIANGGQENCNVDAEIAREAEILGDACDPVPCPAFEPVMTVATSNPKSWYTAT